MSRFNDHKVVKNDLVRIVSNELHWKQLYRKKILITGGAGFLGAYLVKSLLLANKTHGLNLEINCIIRDIDKINVRLVEYKSRKDINFIEHDLSKFLPKEIPKCEYIIHCASQASPKYYGTDPVGTLIPNSFGTMSLLNYAVESGSEKFLYFSSGEVYGSTVDINKPITEVDVGFLDPMKVRSCYAESKRMGETMCVAWAHQYGLHTNIVRPFHTYGPGMDLNDGRVFADFVADVVANRDIKLKSDGAAKRAFCYIADATSGFFRVLLQGGKAEAYNVANSDAEISIRNLAYTLANLFEDRKVGVILENRDDEASYLTSPIDRALPNIDKIKKINWFPSTGIEIGFKRTIESYLQ